jgi:gluconate 2-dehydrogenase gamma chain
MADVDRRRVLQWLGAAPVAAGFAWSASEAHAASGLAQAARAAAAKPGPAFQPKFFTAHEWETVRALADAIIPRDERSGSATDAGVPEFIDFVLIDEPRLAHETGRQTAMRGGLAWIDLECQRRFDKTFVTCTVAERAALLDDVSQPLPDAPPAFEFASLRDLVATGFWTSRMGVDDLQYVGNRVVSEWNGCPDEALKKLGVSYSKG